MRADLSYRRALKTAVLKAHTPKPNKPWKSIHFVYRRGPKITVLKGGLKVTPEATARVGSLRGGGRRRGGPRG